MWSCCLVLVHLIGAGRAALAEAQPGKLGRALAQPVVWWGALPRTGRPCAKMGTCVADEKCFLWVGCLCFLWQSGHGRVHSTCAERAGWLCSQRTSPAPSLESGRKKGKGLGNAPAQVVLEAGLWPVRALPGHRPAAAARKATISPSIRAGARGEVYLLPMGWRGTSWPVCPRCSIQDVPSLTPGAL